MKALIFGINGQDGHYLTKLLEANSIEVVGVSRKNASIIGDVSNYNLVSELIKRFKPEYTFHLAAESKTAHEYLFQNNASIYQGALNILESSYHFNKKSKIFLSGSGLQFKNESQPIHENDPFEIREAYSLSRVNAVNAGRYFRFLGLRVYIGYFFNHDSPLRLEHHLNQKIVQAVKRIKQHEHVILEIGDPNVKKEFMFAGDAVEAVWRLLQNDNIYEAVIGTGIAYPISDWLKICFDRNELNWKKYVHINNSWKSDHKILVSNPSTITSLGWKPNIDIYQLADLMFQ